MPVQRAVSMPDDGAALNIRLGRQLCAAREARELHIEECAQVLRLPARVLKKLEAGDYAGISEGVYLRNYLTSYGAHVGLPEDMLQSAIRQIAPVEEQPTLVSTGGIPRAHYLWQRYTTFGTYAVLTAVIVVPLVWLGLKGGLDRELTRLEPLSPAPVSAQVRGQALAGADATGTTGSLRVEKPLMASMAPFTALDNVDAGPLVITAPPQPVMDAAAHTLSIALSGPSWVEVTTSSGKHLEYDLLPAGAHKIYHSADPLLVSIGDTAAASVQVDGKPVDLGPFGHANVAHFRVVPEDGHAVVKSM